jgi:hypothetical protein
VIEAIAIENTILKAESIDSDKLEAISQENTVLEALEE